jgi:hypothetical protein
MTVTTDVLDAELRTWGRRVIAALAIISLAGLIGLFGVHGLYNTCEGIFLSEQAKGSSSKWSWIPPGVECTIEKADGSTERGVVPWTMR